MAIQVIDQNAYLQMKQMKQMRDLRYTAYGMHTVPGSTAPILAYTGEYLDTVSQLYLLGHGHRPYSSQLMRFTTPDAHSPFLLGGINSYCYCKGDPINFSDPSGKMRAPLRPANNLKPHYSGNPTLRRAENLRRREGTLRLRASQALERARQDVQLAQDALQVATNSITATNNTPNSIIRRIYSPTAELDLQRYLDLRARSDESFSHSTSLSTRAERVDAKRTALLKTEWENVPPPQVSPPVIPGQTNQITTIQPLAASIRGITVRGTDP